MIITRLERQKKRRHRVSVYLDGDFAFGVNDEAVYRFGLHKGMEIDEARRKEIEEYDQRVQAKLVGERFIAARMRSEKELRQRLRREEYRDEIINETVETFRRIRLIDDAAFAEAWVRDRLRMRPRAASMLRYELRGKGIADEIIEDVLATLLGEGREEAVAMQLAEKYCASHASLEDEVLKRRLAGFLQRKGYAAGLVYRIVSEVMEKR